MDAPTAPVPPEEWTADVVLADGGTVHVRPIRPDDGARLLAFHNSLSDRSRYYRFFSPKPRLTEREVERFTHVDYTDRVALVATLGDELVAIARFDRWPGRDEAEVAFTVADAHQGRGISTLLLEHLAAVARELGISGFTAEVLPDNRAMLGVFRKAGFEVHDQFSGGLIDVHFPIEPTRAYLETVEAREQRAESRSIARLVAPRSIAVIGASGRVGTIGHQVFSNLLEGGFDGPVYPINPTVPHVLSVPTYPSVLDVADDVHLGIIAVPIETVPEVLEQCAAKRVRGVIVFATAPGDPAADASVPHHIAQVARRNGMRLIGPGSMGLIATGRRGTMHASFAPVVVQPGRVALSSQSGPLGIAMLEAANRLGVGISSFVSLGTKGDVSANDFLQFWHDDPSTDVVLLYTESFGNPRKFGRIARRVGRRKPIVAVKAGRTLAGTDASDDVAADALYLQSGVLRVDTVGELFDVGRVLASQPLPAGPNVAVVTNARSPAVLAVDGLVAAGLRPAALAPSTIEALAERVPSDVVVANPLDLTHHSVASDYRFALDRVLADPGVDAVLAVHAPPLMGDLDDFAKAITAAAAPWDKPVLAVALGRHDGPLIAGSTSGVPAFAFPEPAAAALGRVVRYASWRARSEGGEPELADVDYEAARAVIDGVLEAEPDGAALSLEATIDVLASYGIPFAAARKVTSVDDAADAATAVGFPVALKAINLERMARSESGGVALDLQSEAEVRAAYDRMCAALGDAMAEAMVQHMAPGGVDVMVSVDAHPAFGPVVTFGLGGAFADVIADRSARSVPLTDVDVADLVASSRAAGALAAGADIGALHDLLSRVGRLVDDIPEIARLRLNPVLASPSGACAVGGAVFVAPLPSSPPDAPVRRL